MQYTIHIQFIDYALYVCVVLYCTLFTIGYPLKCNFFSLLFNGVRGELHASPDQPSNIFSP